MRQTPSHYTIRVRIGTEIAQTNVRSNQNDLVFPCDSSMAPVLPSFGCVNMHFRAIWHSSVAHISVGGFGRLNWTALEIINSTMQYQFNAWCFSMHKYIVMIEIW